MYEIIGKINRIEEVKVINENFKVRDFFIDYMLNKDYLQTVRIKLIQNHVEFLEGYDVGDSIKIFFNIKGRDNGDNNFTNLEAWKIESVSRDEKQKEEQIHIVERYITLEERNDAVLPF